MIVETLSKDGRFVGLNIGLDNAQKHFPRSHQSIELLIGHLHIHCELKPSFWIDRPEIYDARLSDWLESQCRGRTRGLCVSLRMTPVGHDSFRVDLQKPAKLATPHVGHKGAHSSASPHGDD
ncbi:MAG TPA: hypothetical protein VN151_04865 [Terracidiphilus sp.]|jgi:hypothetical protein|nr:hypothetical protein [Terracidiphilus sp.]